MWGKWFEAPWVNKRELYSLLLILGHQSSSFYLLKVIIQVQNGNGVLKRLVPFLKCMELACRVFQASLKCFQGTGRPGTNRDGTSRCPFVPGQKKILVPVSRCPGTRAGANVPGQTPLSRPVPGQNDLKIFKKKDQISHFRTSFLCFRTSFPVLEHTFLF